VLSPMQFSCTVCALTAINSDHEKAHGDRHLIRIRINYIVTTLTMMCPARKFPLSQENPLFFYVMCARRALLDLRIFMIVNRF
jgi:hypothetical protein